MQWAYANLSSFTLKDGKLEPIGKRRPKPPSPSAMHWVLYGLKHPERFLDKLHKQALGDKKKHDPQEQAKVDEGSERALALCKSCLANETAKQAQEDAELATRPNAAQIGATLQAQLREALNREKELRINVEAKERSARAEAVGQEERVEALIRMALAECDADATQRGIDIAARPDPSKVCGSLQKALKDAVERQEQLQKQAQALEGNGAAEESIRAAEAWA
jgi:hypothetical protein